MVGPLSKEMGKDYQLFLIRESREYSQIKEIFLIKHGRKVQNSITNKRTECCLFESLEQSRLFIPD